jgi:two-component system LytT family response regulator
MITAFIVDDEKLAREGIRLMLKKEVDVEVVGEAADGPSAMKSISKMTPNLLFLDVQVPGLDGFEILDRCQRGPTPLVIFTTAYEKYAVKAFEAHAVDYLLKPIRAQRLREAVQRVRVELAKEPAPGHEAAAQPALAWPANPRRLVVRDRDRYLLLKASEVDWIQSAANYVQLHAHGRCYLVRMTMNEIETQLEGLSFARIHRSTIVNIDRLTEIRPSPHGDFQVVLDNGTTLRLSRAYRDHLLPR